ncbi:ATP-binding cassette domain-containing protein [Bacteroides uniformis]|uniref:ATP-binding cassette domain-containing protein n=1 Tax=Bacteroides uniformis TaxID=820 RepID=UPI003F260D68
MITIENTSYGYKSNPLIFNNISLEIGNGIYGLLGENGVGKTTLMHLICGLLFPKNGKCSIDGRNTAEKQSEGLARYFFLPEELQMPTESIASFAARHSVFYPHFNQEEFKLNLEELKINRKQKLSSVSYGQQKKAMLAYAFALHTPYTLLDEPTNGLDITSRQALKRIISRSMDDESTLLISTHQAHDFENLLDHLIILGKGEILLNRSLDEISNRLLFARTDILPEERIYSEENLSGYFSIIPNEDGEENTPDIELLYKAVLQQPEKIKSMFQ